jgi:hypothetical protein
LGAYGSLSRGYDLDYLLRESSKGAEGYYLSATDEIGEPPGIWTGRAGPMLGLTIDAEDSGGDRFDQVLVSGPPGRRLRGTARG